MTSSADAVEAYIEQAGASLSEADKRYIRAFGVPAGYTHEGPARRPYAGSIRVVDAPDDDGHAARAERDARDENDYLDALHHGAA